jgi:uncharacterized protein
MLQETPISFTNRKGLRLFGILHTPTFSRDDGLTVVLLSPGVKMRVGPQCLYRRMSDAFVRLGIPVFRFDFYGLGDSEGALPEELLRDVYNHIEVGRFVDDTVDAMEWLQTHTNSKRFILSGLCGGAITGLLAGGRDSRVAGLLALGMTPVLAASGADASRYMTIGQLEQQRHKYVRRLLRLKSWLRLLTLKSDYRLIWRFMSHPMKRWLPAVQTPETTQSPTDNANPLFPTAFFRMVDSQRPILLVFGENDRLQWEFEEKFLARHKARLSTVADRYNVHVIKQANHVLSRREWQDEMLAVATTWFSSHFGLSEGTSRQAVGSPSLLRSH